MRTTTACSWCRTMNDAEQRDCLNCGHDAHVACSQCRCSVCTVMVKIGDTDTTLLLVAADSARHHVARRAMRGHIPGPKVPADKIDHIAAGRALQYIVYHNLKNWPGQYVLREMNVHRDGEATTFVPRIIHADLYKIRELIPAGYVNMGRSATDAACVVEVWV